MKKKFLFGLIAFLSVSLLFMGCSTDDDDEEEVEPFSNVTGDYDLLTSRLGVTLNGNDTNLEITASKSDWTGTVYITVRSKTGETLPNVADFTGANALWGAKPGSTPGKWADMGLDLSASFPEAITDKVLALKSTNQGYRYYQGVPEEALLSSAPNAPLKTEPNIYIPESAAGLPIKWTLHDAKELEGEGEFGLILWSSADPKVITIEVAEYETFETDADKVADVAKIVIDYSGVEFD